ncbi:MAG TPA: MarR family transcriptional regulator [Dehalococcoidia bacterium]|nr:MarR family transcriptional regulator [Dehalococcoidia bacterium]
MNDSIERAINAYLGALHVIDPLRLRLWDSRGATTTQLRVMYLIRELCQPSTGELAERLGVRPATLTGLADRMERSGFVRRWTDEVDRRVVRIALTHEGSALLDEVAAAGRAFLGAIFERMGPEARDELSQALERFAETAAALAESERQPG